MLSAFAKAFGQLSDAPIRRLVLVCLGGAILAFGLLFALIGWTLGHTVLFDIWWLEGVVDGLGALATLALTWLLFPAVASALIGLFLDRIAAAVEARHYPGLAPARPIGFIESLITAGKLVAAMLVLNILALPLYLFPGINLLVFFGLNGYLLGREYCELAALRRMDGKAAEGLRKAHGIRVFLAGVVIAFLLTLPGINLIAPVVGTAAMVHLVEAWRPRTREGDR
jgi:uncharacterized protein involved in cysteine biosynthesis